MRAAAQGNIAPLLRRKCNVLIDGWRLQLVGSRLADKDQDQDKGGV